MKKRFLSAALTVAMAVSMTACSSKPAETAPATEAAAPVETEAAGEETEAKEAAADTGDKELITVGYARLDNLKNRIFQIQIYRRKRL